MYPHHPPSSARTPTFAPPRVPTFKTYHDLVAGDTASPAAGPDYAARLSAWRVGGWDAYRRAMADVGKTDAERAAERESERAAIAAEQERREEEHRLAREEERAARQRWEEEREGAERVAREAEWADMGVRREGERVAERTAEGERERIRKGRKEMEKAEGEQRRARERERRDREKTREVERAAREKERREKRNLREKVKLEEKAQREREEKLARKLRHAEKKGRAVEAKEKGTVGEGQAMASVIESDGDSKQRRSDKRGEGSSRRSKDEKKSKDKTKSKASNKDKKSSRSIKSKHGGAVEEHSDDSIFVFDAGRMATMSPGIGNSMPPPPPPFPTWADLPSPPLAARSAGLPPPPPIHLPDAPPQVPSMAVHLPEDTPLASTDRGGERSLPIHATTVAAEDASEAFQLEPAVGHAAAGSHVTSTPLAIRGISGEKQRRVKISEELFGSESSSESDVDLGQRRRLYFIGDAPSPPV